MMRALRFALISMAVLGMVLGSRATATEAARSWCLADPVVLIDGQLSDVFVTSDLAMLKQANGPIRMVITIPATSRGSVVLTDLGFLHGYQITFKKSASLTKTRRHTQVSVTVFAPSTATLPVTVTLAPRHLADGVIAVLVGQSASGQSNTWVTLKTS